MTPEQKRAELLNRLDALDETITRRYGYGIANEVVRDAIAEIQRLDKHMARLGDDKAMSDPVENTEGDAYIKNVNELFARIAYARKHRYPEDE